MGNDVVLKPDYYEEDQEEVLSLRDLPLSPPSNSSSATDHHHTTTATTTNHSHRSSADFTFFEFHDGEDAAADDIIFRGHLLPVAPPPPPPPPRRSLSLSSASSAALTRHTSTNSRPMRPSRSLHCRKLHRNSSLNSKTESFSRNPSNSKSSRSSSNNNSDNPKLPPWYWLVLGVPARVPVEMDMKDIKNRQFRRSSSPASLFSGDRSSSSVSWRFLSVLSCKSHASVDVMNTTASFHGRHDNFIPNT